LSTTFTTLVVSKNGIRFAKAVEELRKLRDPETAKEKVWNMPDNKETATTATQRCEFAYRKARALALLHGTELAEHRKIFENARGAPDDRDKKNKKDEYVAVLTAFADCTYGRQKKQPRDNKSERDTPEFGDITALANSETPCDTLDWMGERASAW
ncbi:unnamed protein product, partial [Amoebophrya sp. A25]